MCPFDEKANLHHAYSVDDCNGLLEERGIGPEAIMYAILVYASADCPETNVGNDKAMYDILSEDEDESGAENNGVMTGDDEPSSPK